MPAGLFMKRELAERVWCVMSERPGPQGEQFCLHSRGQTEAAAHPVPSPSFTGHLDGLISSKLSSRLRRKDSQGVCPRWPPPGIFSQAVT